MKKKEIIKLIKEIRIKEVDVEFGIRQVDVGSVVFHQFHDGSCKITIYGHKK